MKDLLSGLRVLVLEDEYLIAMDVEQLCRDHGATDVTLARDVDDGTLPRLHEFDVAIVDLMLGGVSTIPFARQLAAAGKPFVFASGYSEQAELETDFPGVRVIGKPYAGEDLVTAVAAACGRL